MLHMFCILIAFRYATLAFWLNRGVMFGSAKVSFNGAITKDRGVRSSQTTPYLAWLRCL